MGPRLLQINVTANWGSHGRIAEDIALGAQKEGWTTAMAYGRHMTPSAQHLFRVGSRFDVYRHVAETRLFDRHGLASVAPTKALVSYIGDYNPDIIHLHNIHGYYLNYPLLFDFLKSWGGPVVWTLHDCWPFTGHCAYFEYAHCDRWKTLCHDCPEKRSYPKSSLIDNSTANYNLKRHYFRLIKDRLTLVPVSSWLAGIAGQSFLSDCRCEVIHNGIDTDQFSPCAQKDTDPRIVLGVASVWDRRKGLDDFCKLAALLPDGYRIVLIGLSRKQIKSLPQGILGLERTADIAELARWYSRASVFVNPTKEDTFPTTNIEALACGTPVVTYRSGGAPETIGSGTGIVVGKDDVNALAGAVLRITAPDGKYTPDACRQRALQNYRRERCCNDYLDLYRRILAL